MNKRNNRLEVITDILIHNVVGSQEELLSLLAERSVFVTQATLSRDLKTLRTSKVPTDMGGYRYVTASMVPIEAPETNGATEAVRQSAVLSVTRTGNLVVLKTRNGYAGSVAYDLDVMNSPLIAGTLAGADTVFVAIREEARLTDVFDMLSAILPANVMNLARRLFIPEGMPESGA